MTKDSVNVKDTVVDEPLFKGPRAGNTTQTMAPKTVNVLDPPDWRPKEEVYGPNESLEPKPRIQVSKVRPFFSKRPESLEDRVTKLEERLDFLLDRIATHNIRSQHKI